MSEQLRDPDLSPLTGDEALERLIEHATDLLVRVGDPVLVEAQRALVALRSPERIAALEQERHLG